MSNSGSLQAIQRMTDARLCEDVEARLVFKGEASRRHVSLMPRNLRAALWLQLASAIDGLKTFTKCAQCATPFEHSRAPRTGKTDPTPASPASAVRAAGCTIGLASIAQGV
jgi:hypothetical protein